MKATIKEVTAPDKTIFQIWVRDSGTPDGHIDCSVTLLDEVDAKEDSEDQKKYKNTLFHPKDEATAIKLIDQLAVDIVKGTFLDKFDTADNKIIHPPTFLTAASAGK